MKLEADYDLHEKDTHDAILGLMMLLESLGIIFDYSIAGDTLIDVKIKDDGKSWDFWA